MGSKKALFAVFFSFLALFCRGQGLPAETFRVRKCHTVSLGMSANDTPPPSVMANVGDAVAVFLPDDKIFLSAIDFNLKIPPPAQEFFEAVAVCFYQDITPLPTPDKIDYQAQGYFFEPLRQGVSCSYQLPLSNTQEQSNSPYSITVKDTDSTKNCVLLRLQLVMKGSSDALLDSFFEIQVSPVFKDIGLLKINATDEATGKVLSSGFEAFIDKEPFEKTKGLLKAGEHHLYLQATGYRNEVRTINIEQAKTTTVSVAFRDTKPTVTIVAPQDTKIFFDDAPVYTLQQPFATVAGEHSIKFVVGNYETIKTLTVSEGKSYKVSLNVDAVVTESD